MTDNRTRPTVDVLIPVRAPAPWLSEALGSVLRQSMTDWRLLVVMDGYSQDVRDALDALPNDTNVKEEVLPDRSGLVAALNHGLRVSDAEFIARLDADDVCRPERLARQVDYLRRTPRCVALGTGVLLIDEAGRPLGIRAQASPGSALRRLRWRSPVAHPSVMLRRAAALQVGGYGPRARHAEDFDLWLRMATLGEIHTLPDQLISYRIHGGQVTADVAFSNETWDTLLRSRLILAGSRGESASMARFRHYCQRAWNSVRGR